MLEESSIDSRGQDMQQGGRSCAERRKKPREQGSGRRRRAGVAERGRGERRDRGRSDKGEHDEKGTTARWHEVAARIGERLRREIGRGGRPRVGDG